MGYRQGSDRVTDWVTDRAIARVTDRATTIARVTDRATTIARVTARVTAGVTAKVTDRPVHCGEKVPFRGNIDGRLLQATCRVRVQVLPPVAVQLR